MLLARSVIGVALVVAVLAACGGGISRERAIEIATAESGVADVTVTRAERGPLLSFSLGRTLADPPQDREAWAITLRGEFPGECVLDAAGREACPPVPTSKLVVIDATTGAFIFSESPAP